MIKSEGESALRTFLYTAFVCSIEKQLLSYETSYCYKPIVIILTILKHIKRFSCPAPCISSHFLNIYTTVVPTTHGTVAARGPRLGGVDVLDAQIHVGARHPLELERHGITLIFDG